MNAKSPDLSQLTPKEKRLLLEQLLHSRAAGPASQPVSPPPDASPGHAQDGRRLEPPPIQPVARDGSLPLSFAQERMWFLNQLDPNSAAYNIPQAIHISGPLDAGLLEQSFNQVVQRHEILRTTFQNVNGSPEQSILPVLRLELPVMDLQGLTAVEREAEARHLAQKLARLPFDLRRGPLLRLTLLRLAAEENTLLLVMHHIISDAWSLGVLVSDAVVYYRALTGDATFSLPPLAYQYADYAHWQRRWLQGEALEAQLAYWIRQLDGAPELLPLPTDRPRPLIQSFQGARQVFTLSPELSVKLKALSRAEGLTLFMTLLAAFKTLLFRYTGQTDLVVGSPVTNRSRPEFQRLIGVFINTLALRTDLSGDPTFRELLKRVHRVALEAYAHQDLPFEKLVDELQLERTLNRMPLFQVMFVMPQSMFRLMEVGSRTVRLIEVHNGTAKMDLVLAVIDQGEHLDLYLEYNTDLFDETTIQRMLDHFHILLQGIVNDPGQHISRLPLLNAAEQHRLLVEWNDTRVDYPDRQGIHELFEAQVEQTPDLTAVIFEEQTLTYQELNYRSNQLANYLRAEGVRPDVLVGICMERSVDMEVALLAVLKAGGAYLPLEPSYPQERLAFMLADSGAPVLLVQERIQYLFPDYPGRMIAVDVEAAEIAAAGLENPPCLAGPYHLAYVMYTSGSTGRPKGVMIQHDSLARYLGWVNERLLGSSVEFLPAVTGLSFDMSLKQLFAPLLRGGAVWIISSETIAQPAELVRALHTRERAGLNCVPSLWKAMLDAIQDGLAPNLTGKLVRLYLGGDQVNPNLIEQTLAGLPEIQIFNIYGPTETTANACVASIRSPQEITIGRPIANIHLYILDMQLQPVPVGVAGEIFLGGPNLGRGYLNQPELTAEKFVPDPFAALFPSLEKGESPRMYRTGDLARYRPDGTVELLGRLDGQVKIRSYRVELGEIQAALGRHPALKEALVVARPEPSGEKRLVAYIILDPGQIASAGDLRRFLKLKLPEYMLPSAFVFIDAIPLMPNGKLDLKALPAPASLRPELRAAYIAPSTEMEKILAAVWQEVLHLDRVGTRDNFFDLGGHSLLVLQVQSKLRETLQQEVSVLDLFQFPTIQSLGAHIEGREPILPYEENDPDSALQAGKQALAKLRSKSRQA
jgi:amino acid adenylation domain-containing protein